LPHKSPEARKAYDAKWREKNRAKTREASRRFRARHLEEHRAYQREYQRAYYHETVKGNPRAAQAARARANEWYAENRERAMLTAKANAGKRRKIARQATPAWANKAAIREMYREAARRSIETGIPHEVDHIVPLRGRKVTGLHVEHNLRVVPKAVNRAKGAVHIS